MKKASLYAVICFGLAALSLTLCLFTFAQSTENLYASVIRIHVLADSDDKEDQERKLIVRDRILSYAGDSLAACKSKEEARLRITESLSDIRLEAEKALRAHSCQDPVSVRLTEEYYPTREYETFSLPAGRYLSLQVEIGQAQGKNWWCVLFPPICLSSALDSEDALMQAGMSRENIKTVNRETKRYEYRFRLIELWEEARKNWHPLF